MNDKIRLPGGGLERTVLKALWEMGEATARALHERTGQADGLAYTTTAKVLDRLFEKRLVHRTRVGKAFVYRPRTARLAVEQAMTRKSLADLFGSEPGPAIATLVDVVDEVAPELLDELARVVAARRRSRRGS